MVYYKERINLHVFYHFCSALQSRCSAIIAYKLWIYYVYKAKSCLSVHLSVCLSTCLSFRLYFWRADNSAVCAFIETILAWNESCVFEEHKVFLQAYRAHCSLTEVPKRQRFKQPLTHKACGWWFESHCTHCFILVK